MYFLKVSREDQNIINTISSDCLVSGIIHSSKHNNSEFFNSFDIQYHQNSKSCVRLYTACTVIKKGFTVNLKRIYSPLQELEKH